MNRTMTLAVSCLLLCASALAQTVGGETEGGSNGEGGSFAQQYFYFDTKHVNCLGRYFWVNQTVRRGEAACGPTFSLPHHSTLKLTFGGTSNGEVMIAGNFDTKLAGHELFYIADEKIATTSDNTSTLYQKAFFALNKKGTWQARGESLHVGKELGFVRLGVEWRIPVGNSRYFYLEPFADPKVKAFGGVIGFRFFGLKLPHPK